MCSPKILYGGLNCRLQRQTYRNESETMDFKTPPHLGAMMILCGAVFGSEISWRAQRLSVGLESATADEAWNGAPEAGRVLALGQGGGISSKLQLCSSFLNVKTANYLAWPPRMKAKPCIAWGPGGSRV